MLGGEGRVLTQEAQIRRHREEGGGGGGRREEDYVRYRVRKGRREVVKGRKGNI